jgi:hypothetical protein
MLYNFYFYFFLTFGPVELHPTELWQLGSQDGATPMMQGIMDLHHDIFFLLILILVFVAWILVRAFSHFHYKSATTGLLTFDSYMIPEDDLELGQSRLLEVDNRVVVPAKTHLRIIVTSADVLHSWTVASAGVKCDAVPGRPLIIPIFYFIILILILVLYGMPVAYAMEGVPVSTPLPTDWKPFPSSGAGASGPSQPNPAPENDWETNFPPVPSDLTPIPSDPSVPSLPSIPSPEGHEVVQQPPAELTTSNPQQGDPASSADVGPSIPHIKERIAEFLSSFGKRKPNSRFLSRIEEDLRLETSSIQKRAKIIEVIEELSHNRDFPPSGQNAAAKLTMLIEAWEKGK